MQLHPTIVSRRDLLLNGHHQPRRGMNHPWHVRQAVSRHCARFAPVSNSNVVASTGTAFPPFREAQFDIILRRQRNRPADNSGLKDYAVIPSRFLNLPNSFEFAGWGTIRKVQLSGEDYTAADAALNELQNERVLGQLTAAALAGNAVLGSLFYAFPAVVVVAGA